MTIAIGLYIGKEAIETLLAAVHVLMEGAPSGVSLESIRDAIAEVPGVKNIHHLHIGPWGSTMCTRRLTWRSRTCL